ncbi:hypothetical protein PTTG_11494, partial [Puccinia triticina 1-1 BBBD Race 1]|uniref:Uncharacterized protein n=1 Tax=Puccinia triticina (isolate 1-1 / race 1 (BBBD)) TaxID=630390 RepID=A0A0C4FE38_PUCT1
METEDMLDHIDSVAKVVERLNELVTEEKPLTTNEIHATALINSLPSDWINCISSLMNQPKISAEQVAMSLRSEYLRRKTYNDDEPVAVSSTKAKHHAEKSSSSNPAKGVTR